MNFLGIGSSAEVDIIVDSPAGRNPIEYFDTNGAKKTAPLSYDGEDITGKLAIYLKRGSLEHQGIRLEFIGQIEMFDDRGNHHEFTAIVKELRRAGELSSNEAISFRFEHVNKPFESYVGANVKLRYFLRCVIVRRLTDIVREQEIYVHQIATFPDRNTNLMMEVGIEDALHIEFEYNKSKYHLNDVIIGKIFFSLVRVKIKYAELSILKKETTGYGPGTYDTTETCMGRFEIMDGAPVRGESIPIRIFLSAYPDLTITMKDIQKKFSVRYCLNLVLVDEGDRRYFKQQEITLWRKSDKKSIGVTVAADNSADKNSTDDDDNNENNKPSNNDKQNNSTNE